MASVDSPGAPSEPFFKTSRGRAMVAIAAIAAVLRVAASLQHASEGMFLSDEVSYLGLARTLFETGRYAPSPEAFPEIFRGPTYTAFLAALMALVGPNLGPLLVLQSICGVGTTVVLALQLGRSMRLAGLPEAHCARSERIAGLLMATSPFLIMRERFLMSEGVCTFALAVAMVAWMRAREDAPLRARLGWSLGAAVAFGVAVLGKSALMLFPGFVMAAELLALWRSGEPLRAFGRTVLPFVLSALVVAPWTARNYAVTHHFIPIGIGGGIYLWLGTKPTTATNTIADDQIPPEVLAAHKRLLAPDTPVEERIQIDAGFSAMGREAIKAAPLPYVKYGLVRGVRLWVASHVDTIKTEPSSLKPFGLLWALVNLALAALAPLLSPRSSYYQLFPFALVPLYFTLVHIPISSGARYSIPAWPQVLCLSAVAASALLERWRARQGQA